MLPIGGFCIAIFAGWVMSKADSQQELELKTPWHYQLWKTLVCYVAPAAVFLVFLNVIKIFD